MASAAQIERFSVIALQVSTELKLYNDCLYKMSLPGKQPDIRYVWTGWPYECLYHPPRTVIIHAAKIQFIEPAAISDLLQQAMALCALDRVYCRDLNSYRICLVPTKTKKPVKQIKSGAAWEWYRKILAKELIKCNT